MRLSAVAMMRFSECADGWEDRASGVARVFYVRGNGERKSESSKDATVFVRVEIFVDPDLRGNSRKQVVRVDMGLATPSLPREPLQYGCMSRELL